MNRGNIKIISTENSAGGIKVDKDIVFNNNPIFSYEAISGINPSIYTNNSLIMNSGNIDINAGEGKIL